jgi:hypothetical protein
MEQASRYWDLLDDIEDDAPITEQVAQRIRENAPSGCLICEIEKEDAQWDDD